MASTESIGSRMTACNDMTKSDGGQQRNNQPTNNGAAAVAAAVAAAQQRDVDGSLAVLWWQWQHGSGAQRDSGIAAEAAWRLRRWRQQAVLVVINS